MQQGDKNTLTLANHRFERGGHESVRNIKMTLSSRKKNLQEQQILKALQNNRAKEGSAPVPLPRHKRVISVRKRSQKELQLSPNDGGVEETNDDSEMNKAVPRKPPRRKLRISTVRRVNREEGHQQVMDMIEEKKTSAEGKTLMHFDLVQIVKVLPASTCLVIQCTISLLRTPGSEF